jgi:protein-disulfide isomerase
MNRNAVLLGIVGLAIVALGVFAWYTMSDSGDQAPTAIAGADDIAPVISADYERTLGSPKAPIKMIEYAAPMCPICANFNRNEFPSLKAQYIDTGKVYYVFRVFPIGNPDFGVEGIARCLPKAQYFPFLDMMYRNQDKWDPDGHEIPDVRAAILNMAALAGMPSDRAARCIDDKDTIARTTQIAQDATARYAVSGTPTFIVDGENVYSGEWPWDQLKALLDAKLRK